MFFGFYPVVRWPCSGSGLHFPVVVLWSSQQYHVSLPFVCLNPRWRRVWELSPIMWVLLGRREEPVYKMSKRSPSLTHVNKVFLWLHAGLFLQRRCLLCLPPPGRFLTAQQTCASKCPGGSFASQLSAACEACAPGCLQCVDAERCIRCQGARRAPLFLQDGQCVGECVRCGVDRLFHVSNVNGSSSVWESIGLSLEIRWEFKRSWQISEAPINKMSGDAFAGRDF